MKARDLCAAWAGFIAMLAAQTLIVFVARPTAPGAALLVICAVGFLFALTCYVRAINHARAHREIEVRDVYASGLGLIVALESQVMHAHLLQPTPLTGVVVAACAVVFAVFSLAYAIAIHARPTEPQPPTPPPSPPPAPAETDANRQPSPEVTAPAPVPTPAPPARRAARRRKRPSAALAS